MITKQPDIRRATGRPIGRTPVLCTVLALAASLIACSPTVKVEAPKEPITINLNIKLDADVRVQLEQQAKKDVASKPIF